MTRSVDSPFWQFLFVGFVEFSLFLMAPAALAQSGSANLALGKPAQMSSQLAPGYEASACVDGIGKGLCHTGRETNPWWQVDLGRSYALGEIDVYNRTTVCCWERERSLVALISDNGSNWQQIYNNNGKDFQLLRIPATGYSARFVRLQLHATDWMNLAQVEVYGPGGSGPASLVSQAASSGPPLTPGDVWVGTDSWDGQRADFTWRVRADGVSFDALMGGKVVAADCCKLLSINGNSMTISHPQGTYHMTISADRLHLTGSFDWVAGSSLVRTIQGHPLPLQYPASATPPTLPPPKTPTQPPPKTPTQPPPGGRPAPAPSIPPDATRLSYPQLFPVTGSRQSVGFKDWVILSAKNEVIQGIVVNYRFNTVGDYPADFSGEVLFDGSGRAQWGVLYGDQSVLGILGTHQQISLKGGTKAYFSQGFGPGRGGVSKGVLAAGITVSGTNGYGVTVNAGYVVTFNSNGQLLTSAPAGPDD
jgi:hypothetical protein